MYLIDTHCHLNDAKFEPDLKDIVTNAKKAGVKKFIVPGYDYISSQRSLELSAKFSNVIFSAVGFHPYEAQHVININYLEKVLNLYPKPSTLNPSIVAIGECGLDYHQYKGYSATGRKDNQKSLFEKQCLIALKNNLPVIIHCREAFDDIFSVLDSLPQMPRGVLHCFSGGLQDIRLAQERHLMIGLDCNITYSKHLQSMLPQIPLSLMVFETDSPYMPPVGHRGERNEPKFLVQTVACVAQILNQSKSLISEIVTKNSLSLFKLDK